MRRTFASTLLAMCCLLVGARVCTVRPGGTSITEALAITMECDTIRVLKGTYREGALTVQRPVVLLGEGWPVIDGGGTGEVIVVNASHVTISGFVIRGTRVSDMNDNAAIKCIGVTDIAITGNRILHCFFGIHLSNVARATIADNEVIGDEAVSETRRANGIHLWKCNHVYILRNTAIHHRDGIYLEFVTDSHVDHNTSAYNSRYGLHFMFSHRDSYTHNLFHDNGAGVAVMFTRDVTMTDNRFERNRGASAYGLLLKEINDAHIERNLFTDNTVGLLVDGCNRADIRDNRFEANGWAVRVFANSTAAHYEGNVFTGNTFDMTTNGDLVLSTLQHNYWDRYRGYDLDRDGVGDVPFRPLSVFALVTERMPYAMVLSRSLMVNLLDQSERLIPTLTPATLEDRAPLMRPPTPGTPTTMNTKGRTAP
ncbi:MAG: nitrous oxide reductase family maturation protein NosD [Flavobacteriales bacterium]|nr:nitrous oxide reductase family maturation protein NosD [Flavobacteriales bacterium]MCC6938187.1 nitrous oxide reductase family maturation protein NosD [Flavobacteriales bacterium]